MSREIKLLCVICNKRVDVKLVTGKEIYPHRKDLHNLKFYQCNCGGYVGVHKDSDKPLGCIVPDYIKKLRIKIHNLIDPIWKNGKMKRKEIYKKISEHIGHEFHTAGITTIQESSQVLEYLENKDLIK